MTAKEQGLPELPRKMSLGLANEFRAYALAALASDTGERGVTDGDLEAVVEASDGRWHDSEFRIDGPDMMAMLRQAAALRAPPAGGELSVAQGQGFVMVPREATPEMLSLALSHVYGSPYWRKDARPIGEFLSGNTATESEMHNIAAHGRDRVIAAYAAMLAAAPAQPDGVQS